MAEHQNFESFSTEELQEELKKRKLMEKETEEKPMNDVLTRWRTKLEKTKDNDPKSSCFSLYIYAHTESCTNYFDITATVTIRSWDDYCRSPVNSNPLVFYSNSREQLLPSDNDIIFLLSKGCTFKIKSAEWERIYKEFDGLKTTFSKICQMLEYSSIWEINADQNVAYEFKSCYLTDHTAYREECLGESLEILEYFETRLKERKVSCQKFVEKLKNGRSDKQILLDKFKKIKELLDETLKEVKGSPNDL